MISFTQVNGEHYFPLLTVAPQRRDSTASGPLRKLHGMKPIRNKLAAAAAAGALLTTAALASAGAASASATTARASGAALRTALHRDLTRYLTARRTAEHISAVSLRVTFPGCQAGHQPGHRDHPLPRRAAGLCPRAVADRQQHQGLHRGDHAPARSRGQAVHQRPDREMAAAVPGLAPHHHPPAARHDQPHPRLPLPARLHRRVRGGSSAPASPPPGWSPTPPVCPSGPPDGTTPTPITSSRR